jgi:hypothetical protein
MFEYDFGRDKKYLGGLPYYKHKPDEFSTNPLYNPLPIKKDDYREKSRPSWMGIPDGLPLLKDKPIQFLDFE